jgi:hypothetical protein
MQLVVALVDIEEMLHNTKRKSKRGFIYYTIIINKKQTMKKF